MERGVKDLAFLRLALDDDMTRTKLRHRGGVFSCGTLIAAPNETVNFGMVISTSRRTGGATLQQALALPAFARHTRQTSQQLSYI